MRILLFFLLVAELKLMILKFNNHAPLKNCLISSVVVMINSILLFCLDLPYLVYAVIILLLLIHLTFAFFRERLREKNSLSPNSIREAIDDLQMGICFADPFGRIVLINKKMQELAGELFEYCPQMLNEMTEALQAPKHGTLISDNCICTQNGVIYRFRLYEHTVDGQTGWKQITVYDITRLYDVVEQLRLENQKLKKINRKLLKMYDRMNDAIYEKEFLELKIYVHDTIGRSIITVRDIMQNDKETEQKIQELKEAVGVLSGRRSTFAEMFDETKQNAAKMGVTIKTKGDIPADPAIENLLTATTRECVTNCLKHANGNELTVTIDKEIFFYRITITNNGKKPKGKIIEGSGLSSLRHCVEANGGEMTLFHFPAFRLVLKLPRKDNNHD